MFRKRKTKEFLEETELNDLAQDDIIGSYEYVIHHSPEMRADYEQWCQDNDLDPKRDITAMAYRLDREQEFEDAIAIGNA